MLSALYANRRHNEEGFTLIELLIVVIIIGILAAIALPIFLNQQQAAVDASVQSDVRNSVAQIIGAQAVKSPTAKLTVSREGTHVLFAVRGATDAPQDATTANDTISGVPASGTAYDLGGYNAKGGKFASAASSFAYDGLTGKFSTAAAPAAAGGTGGNGGNTGGTGGSTHTPTSLTGTQDNNGAVSFTNGAHFGGNSNFNYTSNGTGAARTGDTISIETLPFVTSAHYTYTDEQYDTTSTHMNNLRVLKADGTALQFDTAPNCTADFSFIPFDGYHNDPNAGYLLINCSAGSVDTNGNYQEDFTGGRVTFTDDNGDPNVVNIPQGISYYGN